MKRPSYMSPPSARNRTCFSSKAFYDHREANIYKLEHSTTQQNTTKNIGRILTYIIFFIPLKPLNTREKKNLLCHQDPLTVKCITFGVWLFS